MNKLLHKIQHFFLYFTVVLPLAAQDPVKVRFGSVIPKDSPWEEGINTYIKNVESKAGGRLRFKTYLGGQLGGEVEMIKSIAMGSLDAGAFSLASIAEALSLPQLQVFELPFLFSSDEEADYVMDQMFEQMSEILAKKGIVLILWGTNGWRSFGTKTKPILSPADLKGLKMRAQESEVYVSFYKAMGATPVPIATPEVLVALKTGMVDGYDQTPVFSLSSSWINTVKHYSLTKHIYQPGAVIISKRFLDKQPADLQQVLLARSERASLQKTARELVRKEDAEVLSSFPGLGVKVHTLTEAQREAFRKAAQPVYTSLESKIGKNLITAVQNHIRTFQQLRKSTSAPTDPKKTQKK
ncbi:MAG: TRAP transporter substrate-binding protein [Flavobacteriales bacterium]|nr:TRAP transporter substrate-binding protein [Flavobacteriales bacterium]MCX7768563.1 TRAP transporter substrate-binding protein [Flavobacteriales bacterium]MDW8409468.1 TRAP transporter substrate-binding protein [Flavobacteriales bacterium]